MKDEVNIKKYYQVFLSSPSKGFEKIRHQITNALIKQDQFFPVAMEFMTADSNTFKMLYNHIKNSDVCVLLMGESSGSTIGDASKYLTQEMKEYLETYIKANAIENIEDLTYTEFEYATAMQLNIKVLAFINKSCIKKILDNEVSEYTQRFYRLIREQVAHDEISTNAVITALNNHFRNYSSAIGWIRETDSKIYNSAMLAGITDISLDGFISKDSLKSMLMDSTIIKIMFTTGKAFFVSNSSLIIDFVANGGNIKFLCIKPNSEEMISIQKIEEAFIHVDRTDIHSEYAEILKEFQEIIKRAEQQNELLNKQIGRIEIGFCTTLFRSSFILFQNEKTNNSKGWFTITLPPAKSRETISFALESSPEKNSHNNLFNRSLQHFNSLWNLMSDNNEIFNITDCSEIKLNKEGNLIKEYWEDKQKTAIANTKKRKRLHSVLIEVAAQHPLQSGKYPNEEFKARLNVSIDLYNKITNEGLGVEIYVPGSLHLDLDGVPDDISLSCAGKNYLIENGIPSTAIRGDDLNEKYDSERFHKGVYNSADECFVASKYFFEKSDEFRQCYSICSPNQAMRKMLFYLEFGIYPKIITVPTDNMFHNFTDELFCSVPYILKEDHSYQDEKSKEALRTRRDRKPQ